MPTTTDHAVPNRRWPATLGLGLALIGAVEALLLADVIARGGAVVPDEPLPPPDGWPGAFARLIARNVTALAWTGFLLAMDGILVRLGGSPARARPRRFALCWLASIPIWLFFDLINFGFMQSWRYHGLPANDLLRLAGYALSFGAICPAMFLVAEAAFRLGPGEVRWRTIAFPTAVRTGFVVLGALFLLFPVVVAAPVGNLTLWIGGALMLDPLNRRLGAPSLLGDWAAGRYGRTLALMAGGFVCGLLWEFWNYWAATKWTYDLPFLGPLEHVRYFEMPVLGLGGFLPFALSCWVTFQTVAWLARRMRLGVEPLPDDGIL